MAEYIEREALLEEINEKIFNINFNSPYQDEVGIMVSGMSRIRDSVEDAPAADVAPVVHGRWVQVICHVEFEDGFVDRLYECCSRCHKSNGRKTSDYCPNCGARMDGE